VGFRIGVCKGYTYRLCTLDLVGMFGLKSCNVMENVDIKVLGLGMKLCETGGENL